MTRAVRLLATLLAAPLVYASVALGAFAGTTSAAASSISSAAAAPHWASRTTPAALGGRVGPSVSFDAARGQLVLFGGCDLSQCHGDTWVWGAAGWSQKITATAPSPRKYAAMAYDAATQTTILYSGFDGNNHGFFYGIGDTWSWDGTTWTQLAPARVPPPIYAGSMDYLPAATALTLFGGTVNGDTADTGTWVFNNSLSSPTWTRSPATDPPARARASMAYDPALGRLVLYGGVACTQSPYSCSSLNDLWTFDGSQWSAGSGFGPQARDSATIAYDSVLGAMVLFGGEHQVNSAGSYLNDTWLFNGTGWQQESIASPPARRSAGMAYDARAGEVILFGGYDGSTALDDTWALDAALSATSISPSTLEQGARGVTGTITGTGFLNPVTVTIGGPGRGVHSSVSAVSPTEVTVRITVRAGTATGSYTVVLTNGDGAVATCAGCLTVTVGPTIASMSPDTASRGQTLTVVITGTGFSQDAVVLGPKGVRFTSIVVRPDGTSLTAAMTVSGTAPTGAHIPVTVRNGPGGAYGAATAALLTIS